MDHTFSEVDRTEGRMQGAAVLVTGGEGFIGSHLVERLLDLGAVVSVADRVSADALQNLAAVRDQICYLELDLREVDLGPMFRDRAFEFVFHFAGNANVPDSAARPWDDFTANVVSTLRLLEASRLMTRAPKIVLASSAAVYGDPQLGSISEAIPPSPVSPYGVSKLATEQYGAVYAHLYGLPLASLRPFSVYGPRLRKQVVYDFIDKLSRAPQRLQAHGDGSQVRDFCYVSDLVEAVLAVATRGNLRGETYNVASGLGTSIRDLLHVIACELGCTPAVEWSGHVRPGEPQHWQADIRRLQSLDWSPQVSLLQGLRKTIDWYQGLPDRGVQTDHQ